MLNEYISSQTLEMRSQNELNDIERYLSPRRIYFCYVKNIMSALKKIYFSCWHIFHVDE